MATSQIFSVSSKLPLSTLAPSGEKEQEVTSLECPLKVYFTIPEATSHILSVPSSLALTSSRPSLE